MEKNIACALVKDLLPNYVEKLTSNETNEILEDHFRICQDCNSEREEMMKEIVVDKVEEVTDFKKFLNKTKLMYLIKGMAVILGIVAVVSTFIVDVAVNHKLTWSLLVDMSLLFAYGVGSVCIYGKKDKVLKTLAVGSVMLIPFLYGMEYVINANYISAPVKWVNTYALPISLIWLGIIWGVVLIQKLTKLRVWNTLGLLFICAIFGSAFTNAIAQNNTLRGIYSNGLEAISSIIYLLAAIACFVIGNVKKDK